MQQEPLIDLIDQIYDTALEPQGWTRTLVSISSYFGSTFVAVIPYADPGALLTSGMEDAAMQAYAAHWWQHDSMVQIGLSDKYNRALVCDWVALGPNRIKRDPYYQEFRRRFDLGACIGATLEPFPGEFGAFSFNFPIDQDPLDDIALRNAATITRHVSRALAISNRLSSPQNAQSGLIEALMRLNCGCAVLDLEARVLMANPVFEDLADDGLKVSGGRVTCARPDDQKGLDRLIRGAMPSMYDPDAPDTMLISRPSGRRPLIAKAVPIAGEKLEGVLPRRVRRKQILLLIVDLEAETRVAREGVLRLVGLTTAEARIAALIGAGRSPREAAAEVGSTEGTVRNQLKQIFSKLDLTKQTDLVRFVHKLAVLD